MPENFYNKGGAASGPGAFLAYSGLELRDRTVKHSSTNIFGSTSCRRDRLSWRGSRLFRFTAIAAALLSLPETAMAIKSDGGNPFPNFSPSCYFGVKDYRPNSPDEADQPIHVTAEEITTEDRSRITLTGEANIEQGNRLIHADEVHYNHETGDMHARGNIYYEDGVITVDRSERMKGNLRTKKLDAEKSVYEIHGGPAHGKADRIIYDQQSKRAIMKGADLTTCAKNNNVWSLHASTLDIDQNEIFGSAWNTSIWIYDTVPVFYFPYLNFPIQNKRKSGLLYPLFTQNSTDGTDYAQPIYFNFAPNYDMTFTPRMMSRRGTLFSDEFRYMITPNHRGVLYGSYIGNDSIEKHEDPELEKRWYVNFYHASSFYNGRVNAGVNYQKVKAGDYNYFSDFSDGSATTSLAQTAWLTWTPVDFTTVAVSAENYQIIIPSTVKPFELLPRVSVRTLWPVDRFSLTTYAEYSDFRHHDDGMSDGGYTGKRMHFEGDLSVPIINRPYLQLNSEMKLMYTIYSQNIPGTLNWYNTYLGYDGLDDSVRRFIPTFKVGGHLVLDREYSLFGRKYTHTIEPTFQYYYVPYRNQENIGLYDTTDRYSDYYYLFGDGRFAGIDRISDENRITLGLVSRVYKQNNDEIARFYAGQSIYLTDQKVTLNPNDKKSDLSRSQLSIGLDLHPNKYINYSGDLAYDTESRHIQRGGSALEYRDEGDRIAQINYRYTRNGNRLMFGNEQVDLSQLGVLAAFPITPELRMDFEYYYDMEQKSTIDRAIRIKYDSCCWGFAISAEQQNKPDNRTMTAERDTMFGFKFEMKGLGSIGTKDSKGELDTRLMPYSQPFNLSD